MAVGDCGGRLMGVVVVVVGVLRQQHGRPGRIGSRGVDVLAVPAAAAAPAAAATAAAPAAAARGVDVADHVGVAVVVEVGADRVAAADGE